MLRRRRPPRHGALADLPPLTILSQILLLQGIFYLSAVVLNFFTAIVWGQKYSLDLVFSWRTLNGGTTLGWTLGLIWMLNSLVGSIAILFVVHRSKLVLDFALTLHFVHLITTSLYTHAIPSNVFWWIINACSAIFMTTLGVWSCQMRELKPINFGGRRDEEGGTYEMVPVAGSEARRD